VYCLCSGKNFVVTREVIMSSCLAPLCEGMCSDGSKPAPFANRNSGHNNNNGNSNRKITNDSAATSVATATTTTTTTTTNTAVWGWNPGRSVCLNGVIGHNLILMTTRCSTVTVTVSKLRMNYNCRPNRLMLYGYS